MKNIFKEWEAKVGDRFINGEGYVVELVGVSMEEKWYEIKRLKDDYTYSVYKNGKLNDPKSNPLDVISFHERVRGQEEAPATETAPATESKEYQQMKALYAGLLETWRKKNADYGNSFDKGVQKRGYVSALCRIDDKFNRIDELLSSGVQLVDDESVKDTLLDLANYCVMLVRYIQEKENEIN